MSTIEESRSEPTEAEHEDYRDKYLRALADFENLRKKKQEEISQARDLGEAQAIRALLPIIDSLERATRAAMEARGEVAMAQVQKGLGLVLENARQILARVGVEGFDSVGHVFVAEVMEAIAEVPNRALPPATVTEEVLRGYHRAGRLLRPAQVVVSSVPDKEDSDG